MNVNKLTEKAQEAVLGAQKLAEEQNHSQIDVEHLLLALINQEDGVVPHVLRRLDIDVNSIKLQVESELNGQPKSSGITQVHMSQRLNQVFSNAEKEAEQMEDKYVISKHLLIAIIDVGKSAAGEILTRNGVTRDAIF
ncbi:unnamed protein product, partial [marine sediment metagenome]